MFTLIIPHIFLQMFDVADLKYCAGCRQTLNIAESKDVSYIYKHNSTLSRKCTACNTLVSRPIFTPFY